MTEQEYNAVRGAIIRSLVELDRTWQAGLGRERDQAPVPEAAAQYDATSPPDYDRGHIFPPLWSHKAIIQYVAKRIRGIFGVNQVKVAIDEIPVYGKYAPLIQKPTISNALRKLVAEGSIELIDQGSGTRPSLYRVAQRAGNTQGASAEESHSRVGSAAEERT